MVRLHIRLASSKECLKTASHLKMAHFQPDKMWYSCKSERGSSLCNELILLQSVNRGLLRYMRFLTIAVKLLNCPKLDAISRTWKIRTMHQIVVLKYLPDASVCCPDTNMRELLLVLSSERFCLILPQVAKTQYCRVPGGRKDQTQSNVKITFKSENQFRTHGKAWQCQLSIGTDCETLIIDGMKIKHFLSLQRSMNHLHGSVLMKVMSVTSGDNKIQCKAQAHEIETSHARHALALREHIWNQRHDIALFTSDRTRQCESVINITALSNVGTLMQVTQQ